MSKDDLVRNIRGHILEYSANGTLFPFLMEKIEDDIHTFLLELSNEIREELNRFDQI